MSTKTSHRRTAAHQSRILDLRQGSRTDRHKSEKDYRRKPKHRGKGWE